MAASKPVRTSRGDSNSNDGGVKSKKEKERKKENKHKDKSRKRSNDEATKAQNAERLELWNRANEAVRTVARDRAHCLICAIPQLKALSVLGLGSLK